MIPVLATKMVSIAVPQSINGTAATTTSIDTKGWRHCQIVVQFGAIGAADLDALKVQESNDDGSADTYADITGLVYGASGYAALPTQTSDNGIFVFNISLLGRDRYLDLILDPGAVATLVSAFAILSRGEEGPDSASDRGFTAELSLPAAS